MMASEGGLDGACLLPVKRLAGLRALPAKEVWMWEAWGTVITYLSMAMGRRKNNEGGDGVENTGL